MIILTEKAVDNWELSVQAWRRLAGEFVQEKHGMAGPATFALLIPELIGVFALIGGAFEKSWALGLSGAGTLATCFAIIFLAEKVAEPFFEARFEAIEKYLRSQPIERVIAQATSIGPGYLGRKFLFNHLDKRDASWSQRHLNDLVVLVRSEELPENQRSTVRHYLTEKHPGWSGAGKGVAENIAA